jgi:hypothetical protein
MTVFWTIDVCALAVICAIYGGCEKAGDPQASRLAAARHVLSHVPMSEEAVAHNGGRSAA